jgi:hypothetical protein
LAPPPSEVASEEKRAPKGGNTRGVVQCGALSCTPGKQACADMSGWKCLPADGVPDPTTVRYLCDDGTDCPQGETCCLGFESALEIYACTKRRGPETNCRMEICAEVGARCPAGQVCEEGTCRAPNRSVTCGSAGRCPKERPLCRWSERAACITYAEYDALAKVQAEPSVLRCSRRTDCGPEARCCTNALWNTTRCLTNCDEANEGDVCTSDADCTTSSGQPKKGKCVSVRNREIASLPAWLRVCAYE